MRSSIQKRPNLFLDFADALKGHPLVRHLVGEFLIGAALRPALVLRAIDLVALLHLPLSPLPRLFICCHRRSL